MPDDGHLGQSTLNNIVTDGYCYPSTNATCNKTLQLFPLPTV